MRKWYNNLSLYQKWQFWTAFGVVTVMIPLVIRFVIYAQAWEASHVGQH